MNSDEIESEPPIEFDDNSQTIKDNTEEINKLEAEVSKMQNRPLFAPALAKVKQKIQKLRDEDNTITY
jgi:hypothetical protein